MAPGEVAELLAAELDGVLPRVHLRRQGRLLGWLGLVPPGTDLRSVLLEFSASVAGGFYAPLAGRVFRVEVPGGLEGPTPSAEAVLVHEWCHALQDQNGILLRLSLVLRDHDDAAFALASLLEGEALLAEILDRAAGTGEAPPSPDELAGEFDLRAVAAEHPGVPHYFREGLALRYLAGYRLVFEARIRRGFDRGWLWSRPPLASGEVLHPERLLDGDGAVGALDLVPPEGFVPAGCRELARNRLGELGLRIWLEEGEVASEEAEAAGAALRGDLVIGFVCPEGGALAWLLAVEGPEAVRRLREAVQRRLLGRPLGPGLRDPPVLRCTRARCLLSAGVADPVARRLLLDTRERRIGGVDALLAAYPELLDRLQALGVPPPEAGAPGPTGAGQGRAAPAGWAGGAPPRGGPRAQGRTR